MLLFTTLFFRQLSS